MKQFLVITTVFILSIMNIHASYSYDTTLISKVDSLPISVSVYTPEECVPIKAVIQLVHGMCEYKERYMPFMQYLTKNGYIAVIHDHRGHGESLFNEEDLGYFGEGGYEAMVDDAHQVTQYIRDSIDASSPLYLFGHSMGSMVVRSYTKRYDNDIDALVVCGSPSYNVGSKIGKTVAHNTGKKKGTHYRSEKIQKLAFGKHNKNIDDATSPNSWICSDPEIVTWYDAEPKCNFIFTANGFENLFALMQDAYSSKNWKVSKPDMPIYFIAGAEDPCIISPKKFLKAVEKMQKVGYTNVTETLYPNMRHEEIGRAHV